jgi:hypothetical protein
MDIDTLRTLAGIRNVASMTPVNFGQGSNISITGSEKAQLQREHKIQPGTQEWFRLWFARPYLTGEKPY